MVNLGIIRLLVEGFYKMYTINIDNRYVFKTKVLDLNCYSVNSTVWKYLDKLFLKALWLNTENLTLKDNICFIEIFKSIFAVEVNKIDGRKNRNINYLSIWHLVEYIEKYATIDQYQKLTVALYNKGGF